MKKLTFALAIFLLLPVCSGCFSTSSSTKEAKVDRALSQGGLPDAPPNAGPGQPQRHFDQEINQGR